jgi:hypothetical protein
MLILGQSLWYLGLRFQKCFFAKALPEDNFKYFSNAIALALSLNVAQTSSFQGFQSVYVKTTTGRVRIHARFWRDRLKKHKNVIIDSI